MALLGVELNANGSTRPYHGPKPDAAILRLIGMAGAIG